MPKFFAEIKPLRKLLAGLKAHHGSSDPMGLHGPHSAAQMRRIIERERTRADRTGEGLSLLVLASEDGSSGQAVTACAAKGFKRQLRSVDDVGWLDDCRLCLLLPATPPSGAWKVADDLRASWCPERLPVVCKVYYYPSGVWSSGKSTAEGESRTSPSARPVEPMEMLFIQRLPAWKRLVDIIGATTALLVFSPLLLGATTAIKVFSPGPVLFKQWRSGCGGKPFQMVKLRSMVVDAEAKQEQLLARNEQDGPAFKIRSDPRVTPVGRLLRRTSIDELPQLWNVLKGEMSLVGPRPLPCSETAECCSWQHRRLDVTPGLTCIWQVEGRSRVSFSDWVRMDIQYIRSPSLGSDMKLLLQTLPALVFRAGV